MNKKKSLKAFTLVELIVVMVILAILAALLIPALTSYIDKANAQSLIVEARGVYTAAQATLSEQYGINKNFSKNIKAGYSPTNKRGYITNFTFAGVQDDLFDNANTKFTSPNEVAAAEILKYLESAKSSDTAKYVFKKTTNPVGQTVNNYVTKDSGPGIIICYKANGLVDFVQMGYNGYLITIQDGVTYVNKNGTFVYYETETPTSTVPTFQND